MRRAHDRPLPSTRSRPLSRRRVLADGERAVAALVAVPAQVEALVGGPDRPWGEVARMRRGTYDLPANGFPGDPFGVFRVLYFDVALDPAKLATSGRTAAIQGDTFVVAVEFSDPVRALVLNTYGNATQPGSPHAGDQLTLSAAGQWRPAWRTRAEIEAHLDAHERLA
jgi:acyl-homoserine-lactone acylase